jgi:hypothetical protein
MDGVDHRESDAGCLDGAALVHADRALDALADEEDAHLVPGHQLPTGARQLHDVRAVVADVVEVAVGGGDDVDPLRRAELLGVVGRGAPAVDPHPPVLGRAVEHAAVSQPGDAQLRHARSSNRCVES